MNIAGLAPSTDRTVDVPSADRSPRDERSHHADAVPPTTWSMRRSKMS